MSKLEPKVTPRIGLLPTGLQIYWEQYPRLRERGMAMYDQLVDGLSAFGEVIPGDILNIGNPNCRVRVQKPIPQFFNEWCVQGPGHHSALGVGDFSKEIEMFAEKMGFDCVRI